ncbi:hypothetical protein [Bacillus sp. UNCCL81]|uniref:hypothetical protein n=1 Tax=Bacillus sp. UNCCL81 TaxID=1502755 RepID=UPI0008EB504F|nr:hypothetical protein [Bacillus sp. UNCCL81]SFC66924.1 hypothetical protein SAMN02799633_01246 [Bacillus sp. UNCCL81]
MFGTVEYFINDFKTCIMNGFCIEPSINLSSYYEQQTEGIKKRLGKSDEKEVHLNNLEKAYKIICEELFGDGRKI